MTTAIEGVMRDGDGNVGAVLWAAALRVMEKVNPECFEVFRGSRYTGITEAGLGLAVDDRRAASTWARAGAFHAVMTARRAIVEGEATGVVGATLAGLPDNWPALWIEVPPDPRSAPPVLELVPPVVESVPEVAVATVEPDLVTLVLPRTSLEMIETAVRRYRKDLIGESAELYTAILDRINETLAKR